MARQTFKRYSSVHPLEVTLHAYDNLYRNVAYWLYVTELHRTSHGYVYRFTFRTIDGYTHLHINYEVKYLPTIDCEGRVLYNTMGVQCLGVQNCMDNVISDQLVTRIYEDYVKNILPYIKDSISFTGRQNSPTKEKKRVEKVRQDLIHLYRVIVAPDFIQGYRSITHEMCKNMFWIDNENCMCRLINNFCYCKRTNLHFARLHIEHVIIGFVYKIKN